MEIFITNITKCWFILIGKPYAINNNSNEIHSLKNIHINCHYPIMHNIRYISQKEFDKIIVTDEYDGCKWCNKEHNTD